MALERSLPVWTARLRIGDDAWSGTLLVHGGIDWLGATPGALADRVRSILQRRLDEGGSPRIPLEILAEIEAFTVEALRVELPRRAGVHDAATLDLPVAVLRARAEVFLAVAPGLGLSWPGTNAEEALDGLRQRVTLQLLAQDTLADGGALLDLVQPRDLEVTREERSFNFPTFAEVRAARKARDRVLEKVTRPFRTGPPGAFEMDRELDALVRAVRTGRSVLLVGGHGVGKSELLREAVRARRDGFGEHPPREADAAGLLLALMDLGGGWQQPLSRMAEELAEQEGWLYVHNLAELFEVGRYEGNETSLAEHLRTAIARGDVRLLAEATPEQVAMLEARYPGNLEPFVRVPVPLPGLSLEAVVRAWAKARGPALGARFHDDGLVEILRLHRRFAPYSGYPGKTLRFLHGLALTLDPGHAEPVDVGRDEVIAHFCAESGLLRALVDPRAPLPYERIHAFFDERVFGQPEAVRALADTLASAKADVARWGRPLASLLLAGPTGVGKTETARATAAFLFGSERRLVRFDMSEYATPGAVARLVGGDAGEGALTAAVRRQPFSVVLFDEVEKAHPAFLDLLLQVLGEGRLTDGRGRTADFSSAVVLMTSNVGAVEARRRSAGFGDGGSAEARYRDAVAAWLRPELLNRIDRVLAYAPLAPVAIERVLDRELVRFRSRPGLARRGFDVSSEARARLAEEGYRPEWGARELLRVVHDRLAAPVAAALDDWRDPLPARVRVDAEGGALVVRLSPGERTDTDDAGDATHARSRALQRRLRDVLEGSVYAERAAHLQALVRAKERAKDRGNAGAARWVDPEPLRQLLAALDETTGRARDLERAAGMAALRGRAEPDLAARLAALEGEALKLGRDLLQAWRPTGSLCILAIYGRDGVATLDRVYRAAAKTLALSVESRTLFLRGKGDFWLENPDEKPPADLGAPVGLELRVTGPAGLWLFSREPGVTVFEGRGGADRVRVELFEGDRAEWQLRRPKDLHRKHYFGEAPKRVVGARVEDRVERWSVPDLDALERRLVESYRDRVFEALG